MYNVADGVAGAVSAGNHNKASGTWGAWVGGGYLNTSSGSSTSLLGGAGHTLSATNDSEAGPTVFAP